MCIRDSGKDRVVEKLDNPQGIKVELKNSQYHVTWNSVAEAYGYEVNASLYSDKAEKNWRKPCTILSGAITMC